MALVSGSRMYEVRVSITPVSQACWKAVCRDCSGAIDSLVELLQGRFSDAVMTRLCEEKTGLFPSPQEILFTCSCPDWASMCKHVAAVLYGIGARLDHQPEMLFTLRKVDQQDLIAGAGSNLAKISKTKTPSTAKILSDDNLAELFGIEIGPVNQSTPVADSVIAAKPAKASSRKRQRKPARRPDAVKAETAVHLSRKRRLTRAQRTAISVRVKAYLGREKTPRTKEVNIGAPATTARSAASMLRQLHEGHTALMRPGSAIRSRSRIEPRRWRSSRSGSGCWDSRRSSSSCCTSRSR